MQQDSTVGLYKIGLYSISIGMAMKEILVYTYV